MSTPLTPDQINQLRSINTWVLSDAIATFGVRLRNEGFATAGFRCLFKSLSPLVGYAATELLDFEMDHHGEGMNQWEQR